MRKRYSQFSTYLANRIELVYGILMLLLVIDRLNCYFRFSRLYTDSDQTILWMVSKDLLSGTVYGPCFYGQSYNPVIEAILSLPLLCGGLKYSDALPLVTTFLSVSPFILLSIYLYLKADKFLGAIPLMVSLGMSVEYQMLSSIPRGFVTGVFFGVSGFILLGFHQSFRAKFAGGLLLGFAIYANMNCALLFPLLLILPRNTWKAAISGFILGASSIGINWWYYHNHPGMVIHESPSLNLSLQSFAKVTGSLDNYFDFVTPVLWRAGWLSLGLFIFVAIRLRQLNRKKYFYIVLSLFAFLIASFFVNKVSDGTNSVFFSGARMFLAYPYAIVFLLILLTRIPLKIPKNQLFAGMILLATALLCLKLIAFDKLLNHALRGSAYTLVKVSTVAGLEANCEALMHFGGNRADLILSAVESTTDQLVTYGCPCLKDSFPETFQPLYERRTWLVEKTMNTVYKRIVLTGADTMIYNRMVQANCKILKVDVDKGWLLVENEVETKNLLKFFKK